MDKYISKTFQNSFNSTAGAAAGLVAVAGTVVLAAKVGDLLYAGATSLFKVFKSEDKKEDKKAS